MSWPAVIGDAPNKRMLATWNLRSISIKTRLRIFFGSVVLLMLFGSVLSFWQFRSVTEHASRAAQAERRLTILLRLNAALITLMSRLHRAAEYEDAGLFDREANRLLSAFQQTVKGTDGHLEDLARESGRHAVLVGSIRHMLHNLPGRVDSFVQLGAIGDWAALHARLLNQVDHTDDVVAALMEQADEDLATARQRLTDDLHRAQDRAAQVLTLTGVASFLAAVALGTLLTRTITKPLADLRSGTKALAAGHFDHRVPVLGNDELAHLATAFNRTAGELGRLFEEVQLERASAEAAHAALDQRAQELARANADLQQFAYSASHDLQEPLRTVALYSQLFQRKYSGHIDATADQYLTYMLRAARQQEQLLRDLLAYTQTNTAANQVQCSTDVNTVLERVLQSLELQIDEHSCVVTACPLPAVKIPEVHVHQLLQNLIANAIRYRSDAAPEIRIAGERQQESCLFSVSDNGIGIDPVYATQIFGIFKRLHGNKYPGTGIGLAICQKIVEGYGGEIWVESKLGRGATFRFTLPAA
jgi:signal transduction histidine kinase